MASSPSVEMLAAHNAVSISSTGRHVDDAIAVTTAPSRHTISGYVGIDDVRRASPTAREPVSLLSPRLLRALRQLMNHTHLSESSDDSLQNESDLEAGISITDDRDRDRTSVVTSAPPIVTCQICLDEVVSDETVELTACGHRFCTLCFARFLTLKINEGQVHLTCFYEHPTTTADGSTPPLLSTVCGAAIARNDIQRLVPPKVFAKFERFQFNQSSSFARQCPHCEFSVLCEGPEQPQCICELCERTFCFTHGNAHDATMSCAQYDKRQLRAEKRNRRKIKRISKACPTCQSRVEKNGGCNHMRCLTCSTDFCWLCGQKVSELVSDHYDWTNIRGCAGQQMVHIHGLTTTNKVLLYLARAAFYLIVYPIAFVLTLVLMLLSCFFALCMVNQDLTFGQVFRWAFRVIAIAGYTAIEFLAVTIVTGFAAGIFGVCWGFHELYKLGKRSVRQCVDVGRRRCRLNCTRPCRSDRAKRQQQVDIVTSPQLLVCEYTRA